MKILKTSQELRLIQNDVTIFNKLPLGVYTLGYNEMTGEFVLHEQNFTEFKIPPKFYGNANEIVNRIVKTVNRKNFKLGVLLHGEKGTGKSIIVKKVINDLKLPVIMIKDYFSNTSALESFLNELKTPVVVFIDEFEKIFNKEQAQTSMLSLMDGTAQSDIVFLLTSNTTDNLTQYLINRPGRVYYSIDFTSLTGDVCKDVISELLEKPDKREMVEKALLIIGRINFDLLISIIEEVNNNDIKDVNELLFYLNVEPARDMFEMTAKFKSNPIYGIKSLITDNPLTMKQVRIDDYVINLRTLKAVELDDDSEEFKALNISKSTWVDVRLLQHDFKNFKVERDIITFETEEFLFEFKKKEITRLLY